MYEALLELHPEINTEAPTFALTTASGHERKTSGSYYTPRSLIQALLDSALDPVLDEAARARNPEAAILSLKVCDPACGSGHFLIAAAHRIARRLAAVRTGDDEPAPEALRHALRDVIGRCIHGVDVNEMAVELCKVALWMEALEPGKPLSFLDHRIVCGNSLLGATPALIARGIPDDAFEPIEGDDKKVTTEWRRRNRREREGQMELPMVAEPGTPYGELGAGFVQLSAMGDETVRDLHERERRHRDLLTSAAYQRAKLLADAWCAAFIWRKRAAAPPPVTEDVLLRLESDPRRAPAATIAEVGRLAAQYHFLHWHLAFPDVFRLPRRGEEPENTQAGWSGGFDLVLGNPPWERVKLQEKEWFATRRPDIAEAPNAAARRKKILALKVDDPVLWAAWLEALREAEGESHLVRNSGRYPLCGRGDINTYSIFAETNRLILGPTGRVGCILPLGIATDDTTKSFFQDTVRSQSLVSVLGFINEEQLFPAVLHNFKFCILTLSGRLAPAVQPEFVFNCYNLEHARDPRRRFPLSRDEIELLNPNTGTAPVFFWRKSAEITKAIYRRVPVLAREGRPNSWGIEFFTMFHMSNDSGLFTTTETTDAVALYEAKMIHQFNHRYASYEMLANGERSHMLPETPPEKLRDPNYVVKPCYYVPCDEVRRRIAGRTDGRWLLGYREITSAGLERTTIWSVLPVVGVGHKIPLVAVRKDVRRLVHCLLACMNSFVLDFCSRQKLGGASYSFFVVRQLPIITAETFGMRCPWDVSATNTAAWVLPRVLELVCTASDLASFARDWDYADTPFRWDEGRRFLLRCELDAAFFHLYGCTREDSEYILETFPLVKSEDIKRYGEYRTKRVILDIYDAMQTAIATGRPYQTILDPPPADPRAAHPARADVQSAHREA